MKCDNSFWKPVNALQIYIRIQKPTFLHISKSLVKTFNYLGVIRKSITSKIADFFRQEEGGGVGGLGGAGGGVCSLFR